MAAVTDVRRAVAERIGQRIRISAHQQAMFWKQVVSEETTEIRKASSLVCQKYAPVADGDRARLQLLRKSHVDQVVFLHVFLREHVFERILSNTATALLQLLQNLNRKRTVKHSGYRYGVAVAEQQPDDDQLELFHWAKHLEPWK